MCQTKNRHDILRLPLEVIRFKIGISIELCQYTKNNSVMMWLINVKLFAKVDFQLQMNAVKLFSLADFRSILCC